MKFFKNGFFPLFSVIFLLLTFNSVSIAEDWPMFKRDTERSGLSSEGASIIGAINWNMNTSSKISCSPVVCQGKVMLGANDGSLYCLDKETGNLIWRAQKSGWIESSPAVYDGKVFTGCMDRFIYALDFSGGAELWRFGTLGWIQGSPLVHGNTVFIGSMDYSMYALDIESGDLKWKYKTSGYISTSPVLAASQNLLIFASNDFNLYALNPATGSRVWNCYLGNSIEATPVYHGSKIIAAGIDNGAGDGTSLDNQIYSIDAQSGGIIWSKKLEKNDMIYSSPVIISDIIIAATYTGKVIGFAFDSGNELWRLHHDNYAIMAPLGATTNMVIAQDHEGKLFNIDPGNGNLKQLGKAPDRLSASPAISDGNIYLACSNGTIYSVKLKF